MKKTVILILTFFSLATGAWADSDIIPGYDVGDVTCFEEAGGLIIEIKTGEALLPGSFGDVRLAKVVLKHPNGDREELDWKYEYNFVKTEPITHCFTFKAREGFNGFHLDMGGPHSDSGQGDFNLALTGGEEIFLKCSFVDHGI